jgi:hypothetical protein
VLGSSIAPPTIRASKTVKELRENFMAVILRDVDMIRRGISLQ